MGLRVALPDLEHWKAQVKCQQAETRSDRRTTPQTRRAESAARLRFLMNGADLMATKVARRLPRQLFGRSSPR